MKKIFLILTAALLVAAFAAKKPATNTAVEIDFFNGTSSEAIVKAKKENKPVFPDLYATWCGPLQNA